MGTAFVTTKTFHEINVQYLLRAGDLVAEGHEILYPGGVFFGWSFNELVAEGAPDVLEIPKPSAPR